MKLSLRDMMLVAAGLLVAMAVSSADAVYADADHAIELTEEPDWNEEWKVDKSYYVTWAHLHACITNDEIRDLDSLRDYLAFQYSPTGDGKTMWDNVQRKGLVAPKDVSALVTDVYWPHHREHLVDAKPMCVEGKSCCCKGRATWGIYVRLDDRAAAFNLMNELKHLENSDGTCVGFEEGGVRREGIDKFAHMSRVPILEKSGPSGGKVAGWFFFALFLLFLILVGIYLYRNPEAVQKIKNLVPMFCIKKQRDDMEENLQEDHPNIDIAEHEAQQLAQFNAAAFNTEFNKTPMGSPAAANMKPMGTDEDGTVEVAVVATNGRGPRTQMPQREAGEITLLDN